MAMSEVGKNIDNRIKMGLLRTANTVKVQKVKPFLAHYEPEKAFSFVSKMQSLLTRAVVAVVSF